MAHADFVHLHVHTQYSLLDGACRLDQLLEEAHRQHLPALAITDHGNMFGAVEFYLKAQSAGIKPIIGCEVYIAPKSRFDRGQEPQDIARHLILLARDETGYRNLIRLVTAGYFEGFYYKPRIDRELLEKYAQGLIGLSACLKGEIPQALLAGNLEAAEETAKFYKELFGSRNFYLELQENGLEEQKAVNRRLVELGKKLDLPLVATNDCHYMYRQHARAHEILLCIQTGKTINDPARLRFSTEEIYFKPPAEMKALFAELPEALKNTLVIAERCNLELEFGRHHLPHYEVPEGYDLDSYLEKLAWEGLARRYPGIDLGDGSHPAVARLRRELEVIKTMRYSGYFLIVWDFINFARKRNIPVGPGRGSAAGSLVAYALNITDIDPLKYKLLFERFLNPERVSMPDIDIDFCMERRDEVIEYVAQKYGRENVAQIITFGTMAARGVIRDVGRALDMPYAEVDRIAKLVPNVLNITLGEAIKQEERLQELERTNEKVAELLQIARTLEGLTRHASTHAAGIVITPRPLIEYIPLYRGPKGEVMTQYSMGALEKIGLLKMDFLGLRTLTVIHNTLRFVNAKRKEPLELESILLDDEKTYRLLSEGQTVGVFQVEGSGMRDLLRRLKPENFADLVALLALFRPGPLSSGMVDDFIKRKHGKVPIRYELPQLEPILRETYGVMVYQEQVMQIASELAGFSMGKADILRRAMGKKDAAVMDAQRKEFVAGAVRNSISQQQAEKIFDLMAHFAGYGFNKSHSAAYALISYQTAYLKAHYPVEFMAALLTSEMENTDKIVKYINECREMGIRILPPDVNESEHNFAVLEGGIRFGLAAVKNVGSAAVEEILARRKEGGRYRSLFDFCNRVDLRVLNRRVIESLIKCGAFDSTGARRAQLMAVLDQAMEEGQARQQDRLQGQTNLFDMLMPQKSGNVGEPPLPEVGEWPESQLLSFEREVIGFYITGHPLARYAQEIGRYTTHSSTDIAGCREGDEVVVAGLVNGVKEIRTRTGERMGFVSLEDLSGFVEVTLLPEVYKAALHLLGSETPLLVRGEAYIKDDVPRVRALEVIPLAKVCQRLTRKVHIRVLLPGLAEENLERVREVLEGFRGECPVYLHLLTSKQYEVVMRAGDGLRVRPCEELVSKMEELLGKNVVYFE